MRLPSRTLTLDLAWRRARQGAIGLCPYTGLDVEESGTYWLCCARTEAPVALHHLARAFPRHDWTVPQAAAWSRVRRPLRLRIDTPRGAAMTVACFRAAMGRAHAFFTAAERARLALQVVAHAEMAQKHAGLGWRSVQSELSRWLQTEARPPSVRLLRRLWSGASAALGARFPELVAPMARWMACEHEAWLPLPMAEAVVVRL